MQFIMNGQSRDRYIKRLEATNTVAEIKDVVAELVRDEPFAYLLLAQAHTVAAVRCRDLGNVPDALRFCHQALTRLRDCLLLAPRIPVNGNAFGRTTPNPPIDEVAPLRSVLEGFWSGFRVEQRMLAQFVLHDSGLLSDFPLMLSTRNARPCWDLFFEGDQFVRLRTSAEADAIFKRFLKEVALKSPHVTEVLRQQACPAEMRAVLIGVFRQNGWKVPLLHTPLLPGVQWRTAAIGLPWTENCSSPTALALLSDEQLCVVSPWLTGTATIVMVLRNGHWQSTVVKATIDELLVDARKTLNDETADIDDRLLRDAHLAIYCMKERLGGGDADCIALLEQYQHTRERDTDAGEARYWECVANGRSLAVDLRWCGTMLRGSLPGHRGSESLSLDEWCAYVLRVLRRVAGAPNTDRGHWIGQFPLAQRDATKRRQDTNTLVDRFLVHPVVVAIHRLCEARTRTFLAVAPQFGLLPWQTVSQTLAAPLVLVPHMQLFGPSARPSPHNNMPADHATADTSSRVSTLATDKQEPDSEANNAVVFVEDQLCSARKGIGANPLPFLAVEQAAGVALAKSVGLEASCQQVTAKGFLEVEAQYVCFQGHSTCDLAHSDETALQFLDHLDSDGLVDPNSDVHVADVFYALRWPRTRLVALSACEAGVTDASLSTMPVALMHGGVKSVLAAAWRVDDAFACAFMTRFHYHLFVEGRPVADAFVAAQTLARCGTSGEWLEFLKSQCRVLKMAPLKERLRHAPLNTMPFADAKDWAAFRLFGSRTSTSDRLVKPSDPNDDNFRLSDAPTRAISGNLLEQRLRALPGSELHSIARAISVVVPRGSEKSDVARVLLSPDK